MRMRRKRCRLPEVAIQGPISASRRRRLRWIFAVIFAAGAALAGPPARAVEVPFSGQQAISTDTARRSSAVAADLDGDGDLDVLVSFQNDDKVSWYENTDGNGTTSTDQALSVLVVITCSGPKVPLPSVFSYHAILSSFW